MIGSILATIAALSGQNAETANPKVDRSGEAAFRALLAEISEKPKYHGLILRSVRESGKQDFYPDGSMEVWREGDKLRVEFGDMWGTSITLVSDGKQVLEDSGADPVVLRKPAKTPTETSPSLTSQGGASSPWFYLMEGPGLLDRLDKDKEIVPGSNPNSVVWDSTLFGKLTLTKVRDDKDLAVWEIEFDNMAFQKQMYSLYPEWFEAPDPSSRWRQKIVLSPNGRYPRGTFETKPAKGRPVQDFRKG